MIDGPRGREKVVRESIQVMHDMGTDIFTARKRHGPAFRTTAHCASKMEMGSTGMASRQDKCLERLQNGIMTINPAFDHAHVFFGDPRNAIRRRRIERRGKVRAEGKQRICHGCQLLPNSFRNVVRQHHTEDGSQFVNGPVRLNAQVGLVNASASEQCRGSVIAGLGVYA